MFRILRFLLYVVLFAAFVVVSGALVNFLNHWDWLNGHRTPPVEGMAQESVALCVEEHYNDRYTFMVGEKFLNLTVNGQSSRLPLDHLLGESLCTVLELSGTEQSLDLQASLDQVYILDSVTVYGWTHTASRVAEDQPHWVNHPMVKVKDGTYQLHLTFTTVDQLESQFNLAW